MSQGHIMPKNFTTPQQIAAQYNNAAQSTTNYNYTLLQNTSPSAIIHNAAYNAGLTGMLRQHMKAAHRYMIDGVSMDFNTFINTLYPDDCAEKTFMILKLKKEQNEI